MAHSERKVRAVTIIDIAKSAGVSKSTVSLVLKRSPLVKEDTRQRVTKAMDALGYVYNRGAASLRRSRADLVGMIINDLSNPFFAELAIGIERALQNSGFIPFIASTAEGVVRRAEVVRSMREHGAARLVRISHTAWCVGAANQRKLLCSNDLSPTRRAPRCRQSVARICLDSQLLKDAK